MVIRFEGAPCRVLLSQYLSGQEKGDGIVLARLFNLSTRKSFRQRFPPELILEEVSVDKQSFSYLYEDADQYWLMNTLSFEQISLPKALIGKRKPFLQHGTTLLVKFIDGQPFSVSFQKVIEASVAFVFPPDHYMSAYKRALLDNGVEVIVSLSVEAGDTVRLHVDSLRSL